MTVEDPTAMPLPPRPGYGTSIAAAAAALLAVSDGAASPLLAAPPTKAAASAEGAAARPTPERTLWFGVYLGEKRTGRMLRERAGGVTHRGVRDAQWSRMHLRLDLTALGRPVVIDREREAWTTEAGAPLEEYEVSRSPQRTTRVRATYAGRTVTYSADLGDGRIRRGSHSIGPGERFYAADPFTGADGGGVAARQGPAERRVRYRDFNPETLALEDADLALSRRAAADGATDPAAREIVAVGNVAVRAYRQPFKMGETSGVYYEDERGEMLRVDLGPIRILRLPKDRALAPLAGAAEVTEIASYPPDRPIESPRALRAATYLLRGLSAPLATADNEVQTAVVRRTDDGGYEAVVNVRTGPAPEPEAGSVPLARIDRQAHAALLRPSLYVPSDHPTIVALAKRLVGTEEDAGRAAGKLSDHVYLVMTYDPGASYGTYRDAAQILASRRGVCQDYATLLVALCRAAGIPARFCGGLAYADGRFYLHAWVEVWTGRWVALEPTWGAPFADATHIKLSEGEPTDERAGASRLDAFKITVLGTDSGENNAPPPGPEREQVD